MDAVSKSTLNPNVNVNAITIRSGIVSDSVIVSSKKHKRDLIVMGSHGRKAIKRLLLSSETLTG